MCIHVCMYVYVCACLSARVSLLICLSLCKQCKLCIHTINLCTHVCIHACMYVRSVLCMYAWMKCMYVWIICLCLMHGMCTCLWSLCMCRWRVVVHAKIWDYFYMKRCNVLFGVHNLYHLHVLVVSMCDLHVMLQLRSVCMMHRILHACTLKSIHQKPRDNKTFFDMLAHVCTRTWTGKSGMPTHQGVCFIHT